MATPNIVPRADQEGGLGTAAKSWGKLFIENAVAGGTAAATISNLDVDKVALDINAANTTANIIDIDATALTTGNAIFIDAAENAQPAILIDHDSTTTAAVNGGNGRLGIQYTKTGATAESAANTQIGLVSQMLDTATNNSGSTVSLTAFKGVVDFANSTGTTSATGLELTVTDAATNIGIDMTVEDGGTDFYIRSSANTNDYLSFLVGAEGATDIKTTDADSTVAHMSLIPDGDLKLTPATGTTYFYDSDNSADYLSLAIGTHGDAKFTTVDGAAAAAHIELEADGNITLDAAGDIALEAAGGDITGDASNYTFTSSTSNKPVLTLENSNTDNQPVELVFKKTAAGADNDLLGDIDWLANNHDSSELIHYAQIQGQIVEANDTDEAGNLKLNVATSDGSAYSLRTGVEITGSASANDLDVTLGFNTTSTTTTAGDLQVTGGGTFGGGTGSTGATISTAGVGTFDGAISSTAATVTGLNYRTIYVDAGGMVPQVTNGAAAGTSESADAYDIMNDYFAFDTSTDEYVQFKTVMPAQWDGGTIKAKFYWKPSSSTDTNHDVVWSISAQAHADGGELGPWGTAASAAADNVIATDSPKKVHITAASGACTIAGSPVAGADELVYFRVMRDVSADDLDEDAYLLGVAIQYRETASADAAW